MAGAISNATALGIGSSASIDGWFGGGQIGWNWQAAGSPWVWGVEVDSQWANIGKDSITVGAGRQRRRERPLTDWTISAPRACASAMLGIA